MRFAKVNSHGLGGGSHGAIRFGCLPSFSALSVLVAARLGFFRRVGLDVEVSCEPGAASLRDRLALGELDAAIGNAGLLYLTYHGWSGLGVRRPLVTGLMLFGGALELVGTKSFVDSVAAWDAAHAETTGPVRGRTFPRSASGRPWTLAVDQESSSSQLAVLRWMEAKRLTLGAGFRLVIVPPSLMAAALSSGHVDACCTAAPWITQAWVAGNGRRLDLGSATEGALPDSAVMVAREFAQDRAADHLRLLSALMEATRFSCAREHQSEMLALLVGSRWFEGVSESTLKLALDGYGPGAGLDPVAGGAPSRERAEWIADMVSVTRGLVPARRVPRELVGRLFRRDLHAQARAVCEGAEAAPRAPIPMPLSTPPLRDERSAFGRPPLDSGLPGVAALAARTPSL